MKIALCMSGLARTFKQCYQSYWDNILSQYDCDVFVYVSKDANSDSMDVMKCVKKIVLEQNPTLDEKDLVRYKLQCKRYSMQGILQQLWKIKMCHNLMLDYQKEHNIAYDWVIRCRPDLKIIRKIDDLTKLDNHYLYVPAYQSFIDRWNGMYDENFVFDYSCACCVSDQFGMSCVKVMDVYARRYDDLEKNCHSGGNAHPESSLQYQLQVNGVKLKFLKPLIQIQR